MDEKLIKWFEEFIPSDQIESFEETFKTKPKRITNSFKAIMAGYKMPSPNEILTVTSYIDDNSYSGLISSEGNDFMSFCPHHFLPFIGSVDIYYYPTDRILGIGKLSRLVDYYTKRFNIQEFIAKDIAEALVDIGKAKAVKVVVRAKHCCVCHRGPSNVNSHNEVVYTINKSDILNFE